jgi:ABC-type multidrug transport system ATPase subunit
MNGNCYSIWDYLVQLTADKQVTVIITTHYIEEAKQADVVSVDSALKSY